jgi:hypothetical protein
LPLPGFADGALLAAAGTAHVRIVNW